MSGRTSSSEKEKLTMDEKETRMRTHIDEKWQSRGREKEKEEDVESSMSRDTYFCASPPFPVD